MFEETARRVRHNLRRFASMAWLNGTFPLRAQVPSRQERGDLSQVKKNNKKRPLMPSSNPDSRNLVEVNPSDPC
jgi:hypothetical protein